MPIKYMIKIDEKIFYWIPVEVKKKHFLLSF